MTMAGQESGKRVDFLRAAGADRVVAEEMLAYCRPFDVSSAPSLADLPLPDEPHVETWRRYAGEAGRDGAVAALRRRLPQLQFPVMEGMSGAEPYRAATRRGLFPGVGPDALLFAEPDRIRLEIHPTPAGAVPLVIAGARADFVALVQALSGRNEPVAVPDSMGACIVTGYNNWDRIHSYRRQWEAEHPDASDDDWRGEFAKVAGRKELYEDRFIILSSGPYSGIPAARAGFDEEEWLELSLSIRRDHECTHYFTWRLYGAMRNNLLDELVADFAGIASTFGRYRSDLALLFFGLEDFPRYRPGARLENYRGNPPLSDRALVVLQRLVHDAVRNLAVIGSGIEARADGNGEEVAAVVGALAGFGLDEIAAADFPQLFAEVIGARSA